VSPVILKTRSSGTKALPAAPHSRRGSVSPFLVARCPLPVTKLVTRCSLSATSVKRPAGGFTLLEILVAMAILGVVVTPVLASFNMVFSSTERLDNSATVFETGKSALDRIVADLENIYILKRPFYKPPGTADPPDPYRFQGSEDPLSGTGFARLRLNSRHHIPLEPGARGIGIAEIVYYVQVRRDGVAVLRRADHLFPYPRFEENVIDPVVCENVKSLAFTYIAEDGTEQETWDSDSAKFGYATPVMVLVRLEVGTGDDTGLFQTAVRLPLTRSKQG
jgi:general secretion pathway protein J